MLVCAGYDFTLALYALPINHIFKVCSPSKTDCPGGFSGGFSPFSFVTGSFFFFFFANAGVS